MSDDLAKKIYDRFIDDCAGWACSLTNIFEDKDTGAKQMPYLEQIEFMNRKRDKNERVIVVLKSRQCLSGDSMIKTMHGDLPIREIVQRKLNCAIWSFDSSGLLTEDKIIDSWYSGIKPVWTIETKYGKKIRATELHEINTISGFKKVKYLTLKDVIVCDGGADKSHYEQINSISFFGFEDTYDLTTEKTSSYIANSIHVHNCGFTTAVKARSMFQAYFGLLPNIIIASAGEKQANRVLAEIKDHYRSMPEPLRPKFIVDNASELLLESGSRITSVPANPQTVRGNSAEVIWDEAGVFGRRESDEFWSAIFPSISKGWSITLISTPKGKDNKFYDLCNPKLDENGNPVEKGVRANKIIKVSWKKVPFIKQFVDETGIEDYSDKMFLQEYCCEFLDSSEDSLFGLNLIDGKFIDKDLELLDLKFLDLIEGPEISESDIVDLKDQFDKIYVGYDPAISEAKDADGSGVCAVGVKDDNWTLLFVKNIQKGLNQAKQCEYVSRLALCLRADKVGFDSTGGMGLTFKERLEETPIRNILVPVVFSNSLKQQSYMEMKHKMEAGKMKSPPHVELRKQALNLGFNPVTGKIAAMGSWRSSKDDLISSLLCAHECRNKKNNSGFSII